MPDRFDELDGALLAGLAVAARSYYWALFDAGFSEDQAMRLTEAWQTSWLTDEQPRPARRNPT
jgi:hypothetical protein